MSNIDSDNPNDWPMFVADIVGGRGETDSDRLDSAQRAADARGRTVFAATADGPVAALPRELPSAGPGIAKRAYEVREFSMGQCVTIVHTCSSSVGAIALASRIAKARPTSLISIEAVAS